MLGDDWFVGVVSVCLCGGCGVDLMELGINKFRGLGGERFLRFKLGV